MSRPEPDSDRPPVGWTARRRLFYLGYLIALPMILALLAEVTLRLCGFGGGEPGQKAAVTANNDHKFVADDQLIWRLRESWQGRERSGASVRTNALGLRGPDLAADRPEGAPRIFFLGDSVTFGVGIEEPSTVPVQLAESLSADHGIAAEVVNGGVPGYSTFQQVRQLELLGAELAPDLLVLGFCLNDITERYTRLAGYGGARFFMGGVDTTVGMGWFERRFRESALRQALGRHLKNKAVREERYRVSRLWLEPDSVDLEAAWANVFAELEQLIRRARSLDRPLVVVVYPYAEQLSDPEERGGPQARLAAFLSERQIPYVDLLRAPSFRTVPVGELFADENHFRPLGSGLAGREIARALIDLGLVEAGGVEARAMLPGATAAAHIRRGVLELWSGDPKAASVRFRDAIELDPESKVGHLDLGIALLQAGEAAEAIPACERAVELDPDNLDARHNLGLAYLQGGQPREAVATYADLLARAPERLASAYNLALAHQGAGDVDAARAALRRVLELEPGNAAATQHLERLDRAGQ